VKDSLYHLDGGNIETYRQMIHHMDEGIGWVMDALARKGLQENTLVIFSSDNGGERFSDNWPLVGGKMDLTEGGIRVPWIAHGPAVIGGRGVCEQHCMTMDWSTTVLDLAQVQPHPDYPLDGVSLRRVLADPEDCFDRPLYWRMKHPSQRALRKGPWKYLRVDEHEYLFNVEDDARERANVAKREPGLLAQMKQDWEAWEKTMPAIPPDAQVRLAYGAADMPSR
jgi:arylsulfatase A-like enzyme